MKRKILGAMIICCLMLLMPLVGTKSLPEQEIFEGEVFRESEEIPQESDPPCGTYMECRFQVLGNISEYYISRPWGLHVGFYYRFLVYLKLNITGKPGESTLLIYNKPGYREWLFSGNRTLECFIFAGTLYVDNQNKSNWVCRGFAHEMETHKVGA